MSNGAVDNPLPSMDDTVALYLAESNCDHPWGRPPFPPLHSMSEYPRNALKTQSKTQSTSPLHESSPPVQSPAFTGLAQIT